LAHNIGKTYLNINQLPDFNLFILKNMKNHRFLLVNAQKLTIKIKNNSYFYSIYQ